MFCVAKLNFDLQSVSKLKGTTSSTTTVRQYSSLQQAIPFVNRIFEKVQKASIELPTLHAPQSSSSSSNGIATATTTNPFDLVSKDLSQLKENMVELLTTEHPFLKLVAKYYLDLKGKRFRPMILILLSRAIDSHRTKQRESALSPKQLQLAEIVEMIHTASIIHDDVIDESTTRRGVTAINHNFSNKLAILAGDYLLARASVSLASLEHHEVTRLISTVISDLVEGEFMQLKPNPTSPSSIFDYYLRKTYLKTASLITNGCRCAALLTNATPNVVQIASDYGENLGLAFQIVDDLLDVVGSSETLGKPAAVDLKLGLATAPVLYAMQEHAELATLISRKFEEPGDVQKAQQLVFNSKGILRTRELAESYCNKAINAAMQLEPSEARDGLVEIAKLVLSRKS